MSIAARAVGPQHRAHVAKVSKASPQHAVLRLLAAQDLTTHELHRLVPMSKPVHFDRFQVVALDNLRDLGLVLLDRSMRPARWCITDEGLITARKLGPYGDPPAANDAQARSPITGQPAAIDVEHQPCRRRLTLGTGDRRPPKLRPGSEVAAVLPSRWGDRLRWADGTITDLDGRPIHPSAGQPARTA